MGVSQKNCHLGALSSCAFQTGEYGVVGYARLLLRSFPMSYSHLGRTRNIDGVTFIEVNRAVP